MYSCKAESACWSGQLQNSAGACMTCETEPVERFASSYQRGFVSSIGYVSQFNLQKGSVLALTPDMRQMFYFLC